MSMSYKITGADAIRLAERDNLTIYCAANPVDNGGIISVDEAREAVREDPSLVCVRVTPRGWWDGQRGSQATVGYDVDSYFTSAGMYLGPDDDGIEPTWDDVS